MSGQEHKPSTDLEPKLIPIHYTTLSFLRTKHHKNIHKVAFYASQVATTFLFNVNLTL